MEFTLEQQAEIARKLQILSSLAFFIGKDFKIPVELNEPGQGWHWDFEKNAPSASIRKTCSSAQSSTCGF